MMDDKLEQENRKFLHDIATPLATLRLVLKRLTKILNNTSVEEDRARILDCLSKALEALEVAEALHAELKKTLFNRESESKKRSA